MVGPRREIPTLDVRYAPAGRRFDRNQIRRGKWQANVDHDHGCQPQRMDQKLRRQRHTLSHSTLRCRSAAESGYGRVANVGDVGIRARALDYGGRHSRCDIRAPCRVSDDKQGPSSVGVALARRVQIEFPGWRFARFSGNCRSADCVPEALRLGEWPPPDGSGSKAARKRTSEQLRRNERAAGRSGGAGGAVGPRGVGSAVGCGGARGAADGSGGRCGRAP